MSKKKIRLDQRLVDEGRAESRNKAQALIMAGRVWIDNHPATKPGTRVFPSTALEIKPGARFVSRGGEKLDGALADLNLNPAGQFGLDIGSSTGGFTDCLLQRGAVKVIAVDVGKNQLHDAIRNDPRVVALEGRHALSLEKKDVNPAPDLIVIDVSFISIKKILSHLPSILSKPALIVGLVKPQFEVGPRFLKKGVVRSEEARAKAVADVIQFAEEKGYKYYNQTPSKLKGPKGNQEFFIQLEWRP